ncbi:MAG: hypothetical protein IT379_36605 [Deltaproteobacteria bacterium]|nr:hypothetical protein [Deltaproteobacteria bacterium]
MQTNRPRFIDGRCGVLLAVLLLGCDGEDIPPRPEACQSDLFGYHRWTRNGVSGEYCSSEVGIAVSGSPPTQIGLLGASFGCDLVPPYFAVGLSFYNIPLESGRSGRLVGGDVRGSRRYPTQFGSSRTGRHAEVLVRVDLPDGFTCPSGEDDVRYSIDGTYHVIRGGSPGDVVDVEVHDVRFLPVDGDDFRLDWVYWRGRVRELENPDPPLHMDGGVMWE